MPRFLVIFTIICSLLTAPYLYFQIRINEAFLAGGDSVSWNVVRIFKFLIYALSAPAFLMTIWFASKKHREVLLSLTGFLYLLALLVVVNYYDYFGIVPHWNQLGNLDEAGDAGSHILKQLIGWEDLFTIACVVVGCGLIVVFLKKPANWLRFSPAFLAIPALALLCIQLNRYPIIPRVNGYGYTLACSHYGIWPTYTVMLKDLIPRDPRVVDFPESQQVTTETPKTGLLNGQNVIVLQVESLDASLIGRQIEGQTVMPFLTELANNGVYFPKCVAMHAGGGSSDAELSSLLSLVPLNIGSGFSTADWSRVVPVSKLLDSQGYTCVALHPNRGSFFERRKRYELMGFTKFYDQMSFSGDGAGWYARDEAFLEQSVEKLRKLKQPFFGYLITMQSHGPFQNHKPETLGYFEGELGGMSEVDQGYIATFREVDQALESFFEQLNDVGLLESTVVVIYGDHESGVVETSRATNGERVPLIISHPKLSGLRNDKLVSHTDIAPTITDLLGIAPDHGWLGVSVFADSSNQVVLPGGVAVIGESSERNENALQVLDYSRSMLGR